MSNNEEYLWVEKYRPKTVNETILPEKLKETFQKIVDSGEIPNMLLTGTAGLGKTTVAKAICNELDIDYIMINGSEEGGIDTLRGKIKQFASTVSLTGGYKVVILDEADYLTHNLQSGLRSFMEEFSKNCRFILTCNYKNRIIEPLHSRCAVYEFNPTRKEIVSLCTLILKRLKHILEKEEKNDVDTNRLADIIKKHNPDWRRILHEVQRGASIGFSSEIITSNYDVLLKYLKEKDFKKMRTWVVNNADTDTSAIFRNIYDKMSEVIVPNSIPQLIIILNDYQYKNAFVADHEINVVACMIEIMANVEFK